MAVRLLGYTDFKREMARDQGYGDLDTVSARDSDVLHRLIQTAVDRVFNAIEPRTGRVHEWSFASPLRSLVVRPAVTGALSVIPARAGDLITFTALTAIFDSDLVGLDLTMDANAQRYTIVEFVRETVVKVIGSARSKFGQTTQLGDRRSFRVAAKDFAGGTTTITHSHATKEFDSLMVGDTASFAGGRDYPIERVDVANNQIVVAGDASAETLALTIKRRAANTTNLTVTPGTIVAAAGTFRDDMGSDADVVRYVVSGNTYVCTGTTAAGQTRMDLTSDLATADQTIDLAFDIEKAFSTDYSAAADTNETTVTATEDVFVADDVNLFIVFTTVVSIRPVNVNLTSYKIVEFIDAKRVKVAGDASRETDNTVSIIHALGTLAETTARTYDGVSTLLTADASVFDSAMVGMALEFPFRLTKYAISAFVSTTQVRVAGDATGEGFPAGDFFVVGPTDLAANDAFTVLNTGADYELDEDFGGMDGPITFEADTVASVVKITSEANIRRARQRLDATGRPRWSAIRPQVHDGTFTQRHDLLLQPAPDGKYTLNFRQIVVMFELDEEHPFPPGGAAYGELYLAACLAVADEEISDRRLLRHDRFQERLETMMQMDGIAIAAEHLGPGYEDGEAGVYRTIPRTQNVTYVPG